MSGYKGISFPFRFGGQGGVTTSTTSLYDFRHIEESIEQIIMTGIGERQLETQFGSEANKQLFKGVDDETEMSILKYYIEEALQRWEPRIAIIDVVIEASNEESKIQCTIEYEVTRYLTSGSLTLLL